jgi:hypothetical protein
MIRRRAIAALMVLIAGIFAVTYLARPHVADDLPGQLAILPTAIDDTETEEPASEQAVLVRIALSQEWGSEEELADIRALGDELERAVARDEVGDYDGDEVEESRCTLYLYGPDADRLYAVVEPVLRVSKLAKQISAWKRYGGADEADVKEIKVAF